MSLAELLPFLVILVISLSFHEAAHAWAADRLGDPTARSLGRLTLNPISHIDPIGTLLFPAIAISTGAPLFGWAKPVPVNMHNLAAPRRDFALVALAGPVSNIVLAFLATLLMGVLGLTPMPIGRMDPSSLLTGVVLLNVTLAVFNMIPVPPLDGGNVLAGLAPESVARTIDMLRPYGFLILYAMLFTGILGTVFGPISDYVLSWFL